MTARTERAVEYAAHRGPEPCEAGCLICEHYDLLRCARGIHCCVDVEGAHIGEWLGRNRSNPDVDSFESAIAFEFPSMRHELGTDPIPLFCEDCIAEIEHGEAPGEPVLSGNVGSLFWDVFINENGRFWGYLCTLDATHGVSWERELDGDYKTLAAAVTFARTEAERLDALEGEADFDLAVLYEEELANPDPLGPLP